MNRDVVSRIVSGLNWKAFIQLSILLFGYAIIQGHLDREEGVKHQATHDGAVGGALGLGYVVRKLTES